jgi:DNA-binding XRE family transcriptional regulator
MRLTLKTGQIWIQIRGDIPETVLNVLRQEYGRRLILRSEIGEPMTDVLNAPLYKQQPREMTPGDYLRFFRQDQNLTQTGLAGKLGTVSRHRISDLENGRRPISRMLALKLSRVFEVSSDKFVG